MYYTTIVRAVQNLNPAVQIDEALSFDYPGSPHGQRTSLYYDKQHITNMEFGEMPEFNEYGDMANVALPISPTLALKNPANFLPGSPVMTYQILAEISSPLFTEAHPKMGRKNREVVYVGGHEVMAERVMVDQSDGQVEHAILLRLYLKRCSLPHTQTKIGWRQVLKNIIAAKVPGITKKALEQELDVTLNDRVDKKTITEMKKEATR